MKREFDALALRTRLPSNALPTLPLVCCALVDTCDFVALPVPIPVTRPERDITSWRVRFRNLLNGEVH